jgi:clan AA aspartic protease (TIGR02281 family)
MPAHPLLAVSAMAAAIFGAALALAPVPDGAPVPAPPGFSPPQSSDGKHSLTLHGDQYGQFWTTGRVNGVAFNLLVDTGATETSFSLADARRFGVDPARLVFDGRASTANGMIRTARARVPWIQVGPLVARDVVVWIGETDCPPLLGMGFLRRFRLVIGRDVLTISEG